MLPDLTNTPGYVPGFPATLGLRELGGLAASDGRTVRHGLLYRGSALVGLSPHEERLVDAFGLRFMLDLRAAGEVEGSPDYVPAGTDYLRIAGMYDEQGDEVDFSPAGITRIMDKIKANAPLFMRDLYVSMALGSPAVRTLVNRLVANDAPLYFHCTAGKDRTGVCAAVILMLLGVPDATIMEEFLLTNTYRAGIINMTPEEMPAGISEHDRQNWAQINSVNASDLQSVFDAIDERFSSRAAYFKETFGLDEHGIADLRDTYLT